MDEVQGTVLVVDRAREWGYSPITLTRWLWQQFGPEGVWWDKASSQWFMPQHISRPRIVERTRPTGVTLRQLKHRKQMPPPLCTIPDLRTGSWKQRIKAKALMDRLLVALEVRG